jgi:hypothetical protein
MHIEWVQPEFLKGAFQLQHDDAVVAELRFEPKPAVTWAYTDPRAARATAGGREWRFTVSRPGVAGFLGYTAVVRIEGSDAGSSALTTFVSRGTVEFARGRRLEWRGGLWRGSTSTFARDGATLVKFGSGSPLQRVVTHVEIMPAARGSDEWPFLAALGLYLRMLSGRVWR